MARNLPEMLTELARAWRGEQQNPDEMNGAARTPRAPKPAAGASRGRATRRYDLPEPSPAVAGTPPVSSGAMPGLSDGPGLDVFLGSPAQGTASGSAGVTGAMFGRPPQRAPDPEIYPAAMPPVQPFLGAEMRSDPTIATPGAPGYGPPPAAPTDMGGYVPSQIPVAPGPTDMDGYPPQPKSMTFSGFAGMGKKPTPAAAPAAAQPPAAVGAPVDQGALGFLLRSALMQKDRETGQYLDPAGGAQAAKRPIRFG